MILRIQLRSKRLLWFVPGRGAGERRVGRAEELKMIEEELLEHYLGLDPSYSGSFRSWDATIGGI